MSKQPQLQSGAGTHVVVMDVRRGWRRLERLRRRATHERLHNAAEDGGEQRAGTRGLGQRQQNDGRRRAAHVIHPRVCCEGVVEQITDSDRGAGV